MSIPWAYEASLQIVDIRTVSLYTFKMLYILLKHPISIDVRKDFFFDSNKLYYIIAEFFMHFSQMFDVGMSLPFLQENSKLK